MTLLAVNWPHVWMVTGLGFCMVILLLVVLIFILKLLGAVISNLVNAPKKSKTASKEVAPAVVEAVATNNQANNGNDDDLAAIAMALHLYFNGVHDDEPTEITLKNAERKYSPWNSKLYGMNNLHR